MNKSLTTTEGIDLSVLDTDQVIDGELAWNVAQFIADAEDDVRVAKGKFWNRCRYGTREDICDYMQAQGYKGWGRDNMAFYAMAVRELIENFQQVDPKHYITHWQMLRNNGVGKEKRPEWIQKVIDNTWTPKQLTEAVQEARTHRVDELKQESLDRDISDGVVGEDTTTENYDERRHEAYDRSTSSERAVPRKTTTSMTIPEACEVFGLGPVSWMTDDTLDILYKGYSKMLHPDVAKDDGVAMQQLNRAKETILKIVR